MRVLYAPELTEHKSITLTVKRDTSMVAVAGAPVIPPPAVEIQPEISPPEPAKPHVESAARPAALPDSATARTAEEPEQPALEPPPALPSVSIAMPEEQRARLERLTRAELAMADRITTEIAPRLKADADLEKLATVKGLIEQTNAALDRSDIQSAANLAHKAKLLATELLSH